MCTGIITRCTEDEHGEREQNPRWTWTKKKKAFFKKKIRKVCQEVRRRDGHYWERFCSPNTEKNTRWSKKCFMELVHELNKRSDCSERCPEDILDRQAPEDLNRWVSKFIAEARRTDGQKYTPRTIHQILSGLLRYMRSVSDSCPNILDKNDARFKNIQRSCETVFRGLHKEGWDYKHAPIISTEEEIQMWDAKVLYVSTPKGLLNAVFFMLERYVAYEEVRSRGAWSHHNLFVPLVQVEICTNTLRMAKKLIWWVGPLRIENKIVEIHAVSDLDVWCFY